MIRGHVALIRQLRCFMETSGLPWTAVKFITDHDEDGRPFFDDDRAEISFRHHGKDVGIYVVAPSSDRIEGKENLPLGKLAGRVEDRVVKGPLDQATWDSIIKLIND